jgi:hypothetical protein
MVGAQGFPADGEVLPAAQQHGHISQVYGRASPGFLSRRILLSN